MSRRLQRRGTVIVLVAFLLPVFIILAGFAINTAVIELYRTELFIAADAAARAGGRELTIGQSETAAMDRAQEYAAKNLVAGQPLQLADGDIEFGKSERQGTARYTFTPNTTTRNALRVTARRDGQSVDGPVAMLFPMPGAPRTVDITQQSISTQVQVDIALVIDRSGSMAYASDEVAQYPPAPRAAPPGWDFCDPAPPQSRWLDVVQAVKVFNTEVAASPSDELVALATYSDSAKVERYLSSNYSSIESALDVYTNQLCSGSTNIGGGILAGINALANSPSQRSGAIKVILVLTDGIHNTGADPVAAARYAASQNIMIFSVTFSDEADQQRMKQVAEVTQGKHFHANDGSQLSEVFAEIARRLPTLLTE